MLRNKKLKNIAVLLAQEQEVSGEVIKHLAEKLTKSELKIVGKFLRLELKKRRVMVTSATELSDEHKKSITQEFKSLEVLYATDSSLGGGIRINAQDTVIDMSVKNYIIQIVQDLTNK